MVYQRLIPPVRLVGSPHRDPSDLQVSAQHSLSEVAQWRAVRDPDAHGEIGDFHGKISGLNMGYGKSPINGGFNGDYMGIIHYIYNHIYIYIHIVYI